MIYNVHRTKRKGIQIMWKLKNFFGDTLFTTTTARDMYEYLWEENEPLNCLRYVESPSGEKVTTMYELGTRGNSGQ